MDQFDPELLSRLVDEHGAALVLYAQQWCRTPEDVVQDAFVRLMRERPAPRDAVAWLYRVVRNAGISASRSRSRRVRHESAAADERRDWFVADSGAGIDARAAVDGLESLPPLERETVVLRLWSGFSFEQIGELAGTSTSTAHRRYADGLAALRLKLGGRPVNPKGC